MPIHQQKVVDEKLGNFPKEVNMLSENFVNMFSGAQGFELMWKRDWTEFGTIFYQEQLKALERMSSNEGFNRGEM